MAVILMTAAVFAVYLRRTSPDMALLLAIAAGSITVLFLLRELTQVTDFLRQLTAKSGVSEELLLPLVKIAAIAFISKTGGDICRDAGETALGNLLETLGAFGALCASLPLLNSAGELLCMI